MHSARRAPQSQGEFLRILGRLIHYPAPSLRRCRLVLRRKHAETFPQSAQLGRMGWNTSTNSNISASLCKQNCPHRTKNIVIQTKLDETDKTMLIDYNETRRSRLANIVQFVGLT